MADTVLDYGEPDDAEGRERRQDDVVMDAEMQDWEQRYVGSADDFETQRQRKMDELVAQRKANKFYALPRDQAVEAGAYRGVVAQPAIANDVLIGDAEDVVSNEAAPETPGTIGQGLDIRYNALHMTGSPVTQCSTSRLFAYITHYGAQPLGLEWINDQSCNVVFSDAAAARLALEYLCPAADATVATAATLPLPSESDIMEAASAKRVHDSGEEAQSHDWPEPFMQSILQPRKAHRIPGALYNAPERDAALELQAFMKEQASRRNVGGSSTADVSSSEVPEIYREMEEEDRKRFMKTSSQAALSSLRANLWLRWTVESYDVKGNRSAAQSKWYREHGRDAGKEVVAKVLQVGGTDERLELLPESGNGQRRGRRRGNVRGSAAMDELDREMDAYRDRADDAVVGGNPEARNRRRRGSRSATTMAALDEEMELDRRDRSASPIRRSYGYGDEVSIKLRGRGRMRAPSAWDDDRKQDGGRRDRRGGKGGGPNAFDLADRLRMPANAHHSDEIPRDNGSDQRSLSSRMAAAGPNQRSDLFDRIR